MLMRNRTWLIALVAYAVIVVPLMMSGLLYADVVVTAGIFFILVMAMDLLFGCAGLLSFGHIGFFAIGAYAPAVLAKFFAASLFPGTLAGLAVNLVLALTLGRVFLRLSGSYFMLGTLAFGIMVHAVIRTWYPVTGGDAGLGDIPRVAIGTLSPQMSLALVIWVTAALLFWFSLNLSSSRVGRALRAIRGDAVSAACCGVDVPRLRINLFALSAGYASISGSLFAAYNGAVHPDSFALSALLDVLLMLFFGGEGTIWGALIGVTLLRVLPDVSGPLQAGKILFSGVLFAVIIFLFPMGVAGALKDGVKRFGRGRSDLRVHGSAGAPGGGAPGRGAAGDTVSGGSAGAVGPLAAAASGEMPVTVIEVDALGQSFGGLRAVDAVSFSVEAGTIRSLIGPNGAGKSTMLNLLSGVQPVREGRVTGLGYRLVGLSPDRIARLGVRRTFQHERLFPHLSVIENVMVGCESGSDGSVGDLMRCGLALPSTRAEAQRVRAASLVWLERIGLADRADDAVSELPHGLRKLVEVARAVAAAPRVLLLDETAAGLNATEKARLKALLRSLRDEGVTTLLIEHDMAFVMDISDRILVLDFGRLIAEGTPDVVRRDPAVLAAYLGV
jgi:branched-chain amino acid transport system permease protein